MNLKIMSLLVLLATGSLSCVDDLHPYYVRARDGRLTADMLKDLTAEQRDTIKSSIEHQIAEIEPRVWGPVKEVLLHPYTLATFCAVAFLGSIYCAERGGANNLVGNYSSEVAQAHQEWIKKMPQELVDAGITAKDIVTSDLLRKADAAVAVWPALKWGAAMVGLHIVAFFAYIKASQARYDFAYNKDRKELLQNLRISLALFENAAAN